MYTPNITSNMQIKIIYIVSLLIFINVISQSCSKSMDFKNFIASENIVKIQN